MKNDSWWLAELVNNQDGRDTESMKLLKNILPEGIIHRMQMGQKLVADSHQHVVILFSGEDRLLAGSLTTTIFQQAAPSADLRGFLNLPGVEASSPYFK